MAGRVKHMERSRRSHKNKEAVFMQFNNRAYRLAMRKIEKQTMAQRLAGVFAPMKKVLRKAADV